MLSALLLYFAARAMCVASPALSFSPFRYYFPDLLAPLVFIPVVVNIGRMCRALPSNQSVSVLGVWWCWVVLTVYFEVLAPTIFPRQTSDPLDAVAYGIGCVVFWGIQRRSSQGRERIASSLSSPQT